MPQGRGRAGLYVPMPESIMYAKSTRRDALVEQYGAPTVAQAEIAVILNLLYLVGMIKPSEFVDAMVDQCRRIDEQRRAEAGLESDRG